MGMFVFTMHGIYDDPIRVKECASCQHPLRLAGLVHCFCRQDKQSCLPKQLQAQQMRGC